MCNALSMKHYGLIEVAVEFSFSSVTVVATIVVVVVAAAIVVVSNSGP